MQAIPNSVPSLDKQNSPEVIIWLKYSSLAMLIFQYTGVTLFVRYARSRPGHLFFSSTAVVLTEIIKEIIAIGILWSQQHFNMQKLQELLMQQLIFDHIDNLKMFIPSILFVIQNNLNYFSLTLLDAATFQVSSQLKILTTAFFSVLLLPNRRYSFIQWFALFTLFIGVALVQWEAQSLKVNSKHISNNSNILFAQSTMFYNSSIPHSELKKNKIQSILESTTLSYISINNSNTTNSINLQSVQEQLKKAKLIKFTFYSENITNAIRIDHMLQRVNKPFLGLCAVILACILSGFASVYFEKVLKASKKSLWIRQMQLSGYGVPLSLVVAYLNDGESIGANGFFFGYNWTVWMCIALQSGGGLLVAIVTKYADNVLKGFSTSIAIMLTSSISVLVFNERLGLFGVLGAIFVVIATVLFSDFTSSIKFCKDSSEENPTNKSENKSYNPIQLNARTELSS